MSNFFKKVKDSLDEKAKQKNNVSSDNNGNNLFGRNMFASNKLDRGGGKTLGGSKPGKLFSISLGEPGPLGVKIEKTSNGRGNAIISHVEIGSQAEAAGLRRGDILCHCNSDGEEEIMYEQFIAMAASNHRPIVFDARRVESSVTSASQNTSAETYARKQAMIAAAEAREMAHKAKSRPIPKKAGGKIPSDTNTQLSSEEKKRIELMREELAKRNELNMALHPLSEESRMAVEATKNEEIIHSKALGYNPYAVATMTAGQAKTATVAMVHGSIDGNDTSINTEANDLNTKETVTSGANDKFDNEHEPINESFDEIFTIIVTTNTENEDLSSSLGTMRKLIINATTKGQQDDNDEASKFRRVKLSNVKIKSAITDINGALELMLCVGFVLHENGDDGETYLIYPLGSKGPDWLQRALKRMERYATSFN